MKKDQEIFQERLNHHHDELRWLYTELYHNDDMFAELCDQMYQYFTARRRALKNRDLEREKNPDWFRQKDMRGMMLYIDNFAGNIKGVSAKLPYLKECNVNCLHLMPFLDTPKAVPTVVTQLRISAKSAQILVPWKIFPPLLTNATKTE